MHQCPLQEMTRPTTQQVSARAQIGLLWNNYVLRLQFINVEMNADEFDESLFTSCYLFSVMNFSMAIIYDLEKTSLRGSKFHRNQD